MTNSEARKRHYERMARSTHYQAMADEVNDWLDSRCRECDEGLGFDESHHTCGAPQPVPELVPFSVDTAGAPVSGNDVWNVNGRVI